MVKRRRRRKGVNGMPEIYDNIEQKLLPSLRETIGKADHGDFCVGYLNLRGWGLIEDVVDGWQGGDGQCCRLLVGMQHLPREQLERLYGINGDTEEIDNRQAIVIKEPVARRIQGAVGDRSSNKS